MSQSLGIVPVNRCEGLALLSFGREPLFASAVRRSAAACDATVVLTAAQRRGRFRRALHLRRVAYDVLAAPVDDDTILDRISASRTVLVHDPLCPLTPADFVDQMVDRAAAGEVVAAVRPVVDTLKETQSQTVVGTIDRERLQIVSAPVAAPAATVRQVCERHGTEILGSSADLVSSLREIGPVSLETAPAAARRIEDPTALALMMSVDAVGHRLRER